ncbi:hypothetical protein [Dokdonia sp. R78006]|uniref:hypothetical protein n=1 Tax=unclassified Dokdonia TaxID=2615033 RepID=UPI0036D2759F
MSTKITYYLIVVLLIIGLYGAGTLVIDELATGDSCPKILHIPMCIVVLVCFLVPLVAHLLKKWNVLYFLFAGLAFGIAFIASIMQYLGEAECPKTESGTPMCYYSLVLFSSIIGLRIFYLKSKNDH